ncbi:MAG: hypothetical protein HRT77_01150 [Halioglobus sp.]|nr:hypothetical protein [Halioglobus sp.]
MIDVFLRQGADRRLPGGLVWVYANEVDSQRSPLGGVAVGELACVRSADGALLGAVPLWSPSPCYAHLLSSGLWMQHGGITIRW